MKNGKMLGNGLLLLTAMIWGTAFAFQRAGMDKIEPITFNAARMALAAIAVGLVALFTRKRGAGSSAGTRSAEEQKQFRKDNIVGGLFCGVFLSLGSIFQQMGLVYTTAGKAGFITAMYILLVPVFGFIIFRRKNTWLVRAAVLLGIVGMYFLCISGDFRLSRGDALVSACALFYTGHILSCDHFGKRGDPIVISTIQFVTATVISAVMAFITEEPSVEKVASALIPILYCGIVSGGIGFTLQIVAQRITEPTTASLLMSMEAVFAVIAGVVLLHERMSVREISGCLIMLAAIVLVQIPVKGKAGQGPAE